VEDKKAVEQALKQYSRSESYIVDGNGLSIESADNATLTLSYTLKNGKQLLRSYTIPVSEDLLADSSSPAARLLDILNNRQNIAADYFPKTVTAADFIAGTIDFYPAGNRTSLALTPAQAGVLYEAALQDLAAGSLGRRYLLKDADYYTQVYQNELELTCYGVFPSLTSDLPEPTTKSMDFYIRTDSVHLIAALKQLGILDDSHTLITQMEWYAAGKGLYYD
jgi:hypothetical protein